MSENVRANVGEIKTVMKEVDEKVETVVDAITQYINMLKRLQMFGVQDDLICAKLSGIADHLKTCRKELDDINGQLRGQTVKYGEIMEKLDRNDWFDFVLAQLNVVERLISTLG